MELPPQGDKLHKSSDHLEKEDVELYSVGTRDTLASHDGVLLSCASHANKVPKLARPPPSPPHPPPQPARPHPSLCSCFCDNAAGPRPPRALLESSGQNQRRTAVASRTGSRRVLGCTAPHSQPGGIQVGGRKPLMDSVAFLSQKGERLREKVEEPAGREPLAGRSPRTPGAGLRCRPRVPHACPVSP